MSEPFFESKDLSIRKFLYPAYFAQVEVPFTQTAGCGSKALTGAFSLHIMTIQLNDGLIVIFTKPIILERRFSK